MLKLLAVLCIAQVVFGACKMGDVEFKQGETKLKQKLCKKGCFEAEYDSSSGNLTSCKSCKDITEEKNSDGTVYLTKEKNCKSTPSCYWKVKCLPGSCPSIVQFFKDQLKDCKADPEENVGDNCEKSYGNKVDEFNAKAICKHYGCLYSSKSRACSIMSQWALIVIIIVVVVVVIVIIVIIIVVILMSKSKPTTVEPAPAGAPAAKAAPQAAPAEAAPADAGPPPEVGPYVVIKLGKQELKTKKVESQVWGQDIIFTGLGPEDDDVVFELYDNNDALLGSSDVRIPDYVNAKKRATVSLKSGEESIGILEVDIEIQVQEEPEVKITGVFFVDKFAKPI